MHLWRGVGMLALALATACLDQPRGVLDGGGPASDAGLDAAPIPVDPCTGGSEAAATILIHGKLTSASDESSLPDELIEATPGEGTVTDPSGDYQVVLDSGGVATAVVLRTHPLDFPPHAAFFQRPFTDDDYLVNLHMRGDSILTPLYTDHGFDLREGAATVIAIILDCDDLPIAGATLAVDPTPDTVVYLGDGATTDDSGLAYGLNVASGPVMLQAEGGEPFWVQADPGGVVLAVVVLTP